MKTKEFIRRVEWKGYKTKWSYKNVSKKKTKLLIFRQEDNYLLAWVFTETENSMRSFDVTDTLFNLLVEYAITPLEERKEEKKYCIKHKHLGTYCNHLNYDTKSSSWAFYDAEKTLSFKTQFTLAELPDWVHEMLEQGHLVKEEVENE